MKVAIDSYCYHRYFGEVYANQKKPAKSMSYADFLRRAVELKVDGVSMETCFFESLDESYLKGLKEIVDRGNLEVVVAWGHPLGFEGGRSPRRRRTCAAFPHLPRAGSKGHEGGRIEPGLPQ